MANKHSQQGGWTLLETLVSAVILSIALLTFLDVFSSSTRLTRDTRAKHRAEETLRRNLESVANLVREADAGTVDGFDAAGVSTNPTFARVEGADENGRIYSATEQLKWKASSSEVPGVSAPGRVVHVRDGSETLIADRVPSGGFSVWFDGDALVVKVRTYYAVDGHLEMATGTTSVALRN